MANVYATSRPHWIAVEANNTPRLMAVFDDTLLLYNRNPNSRATFMGNIGSPSKSLLT